MTAVVGRRYTDFDDEATFAKGRLGVKPVLARVTPAAGRGGRRIITGDRDNLRRVIGKAQVEKFAPVRPAGLLAGAKTGARRMGASARGGLAAGRAGIKLPTFGGGVNQGISGAANFMGRRPVASSMFAAAGGGLAAKRFDGVEKKDRYYDPDSRRSAHQGAAAGVLGVGGVGSLGYGLREAYVRGNPMRDLPNYSAGKPPVQQTDFRYQGGAHHGKPRKPLAGEEDAARARHEQKTKAYQSRKELEDAIARAKKTKGRFVSGRAAGASLAGAAMLGGAGALHRRAKEAPYR